MEVHKQSGQIEEFNLDKLRTSIIKSCQATGDQPKTAEQFAEQVCSQVEDWLIDKTAITSNDLASQVGGFLTKYNPEASQYYQNFKKIF